MDIKNIEKELMKVPDIKGRINQYHKIGEIITMIKEELL